MAFPALFAFLSIDIGAIAYPLPLEFARRRNAQARRGVSRTGQLFALRGRRDGSWIKTCLHLILRNGVLFYLTD